MNTNHKPLCLGIDTGGTFTDGVLLDLSTRMVIKTTKTLTTHHDLKVCIGNVLAQLVDNSTENISFVSLSTTLATNAIAEGKRRQVGLFLLGYDPELVYRYQFEKQFGTRHYRFIDGRHDQNGKEQVVLDIKGLSREILGLRDSIDAVAIASYSAPRNATHEILSGELAQELTKLPIVLAHHLSDDLDSIRRATTASLNASLLSNLDEFVSAVLAMLLDKGIQAPLLMVRGDGSIVNTDFARSHPVEMIHSGPATSTIGGQFLANVDDALIIDIGGTTTDISLVSRGKAQILNQAATVGEYRTCVRTIRTRSIGLGGDSCIHFDRQRTLTIGPDRVIPLAYFCQEYPDSKTDLLEYVTEKGSIHYSDEIEYWIFRREPRIPFEDERINRAIQILKEGPVRMRKLMKMVGAASPVLLDYPALINQDIILKAGLTPTDLLHVNGEFAPWDRDIAETVTRSVALNWEEPVSDFSLRIQSEITHRIVAEVIEFLTEKKLSEPTYLSRHDSMDRWLFEENIKPKNQFLSCNIILKIPLVGIGAPAKAYLLDVARILGTDIILPDHYEVANAVGTVVGSVLVRLEADVFPCVEGHAITGFFARVASQQVKFVDFADAVGYAKKVLEESLIEAAIEAGAGEPRIEMIEDGTPNQMLHISAWATGQPDLSQPDLNQPDIA